VHDEADGRHERSAEAVYDHVRAEGYQVDPLDVPELSAPNPGDHHHDPKGHRNGVEHVKRWPAGLASGRKPTLTAGEQKNYFAYHGSGRDPNVESWTNSVDCSDAPSVTIHRWEDDELPAKAQRPVAAPRRPGHHPKLHDESPDADDPLGRAR
jgi:hypothetical protein